MAAKSNSRPSTITFEIGNVKLVLDGKKNTITLSAPTVVLDSRKILYHSKENKLHTLGVHQHTCLGTGKGTTPSG